MVNSNSSPQILTFRTSMMHFISLHRFLFSDFQVPAPHLSSDRCLATPTASPLSKSKVLQGILQSICKVYGHAQHTFLQFCHYNSLLPVPADQETLVLCYFPSRCQRPPAQNNPQIPIWGESTTHQHGSVRPTERCFPAAQRPLGHPYPV